MIGFGRVIRESVTGALRVDAMTVEASTGTPEVEMTVAPDPDPVISVVAATGMLEVEVAIAPNPDPAVSVMAATGVEVAIVPDPDPVVAATKLRWR